MISLSVVHWLMLENGWTFADGPGVLKDPLQGAQFLHEIYTRADPTYTGRVTVPVLWDKATDTLVSNESSEIIRMLNSAFDSIGAFPGDYYPEALRPEIDALNERIYHTVNNVSLRAAAGLVGDGGGDRLDGGADNDQLYGYDGDDVSAGYLGTFPLLQQVHSWDILGLSIFNSAPLDI